MSRRAFTLTEMLVTMGLLLVLATMVVGVSLALWTRGENVHSGATSIQQAFRIAKSRAIANHRPVGVRLYTTNYLATELHFIEQPDDFGGRQVIYQTLGDTNVIRMVYGNGIDFTSGLQHKDAWPVQPGDYLEISGGGLIHRITDVQPLMLTLASNVSDGTAEHILPNDLQWRIIRSPRTLIGEEPIKLPANVVIDTLTNKTYSNPLPYVGDANGNGQIDILFAPSGRVLDNSNSKGSFLWVRRFDSDNPRAGALVITIKYATGWIAVNQIDENGTNPYSIADDPHLSGL